MPFFSFFFVSGTSPIMKEVNAVKDIKSLKYETISETLRTIGDVFFALGSVFYMLKRIHYYKVKRGE